jgi:hypothetical protein
MEISKQLEGLKQQQIIAGQPVKITLSKEMAKEIFRNRSENGRPVSLIQEAFWATRIITGNFDAEKSLLLFDELTYELTDGGQRLAGFIESGQQQLETYVYFVGPDYELTVNIMERFYKH